MYHRMCFYRYTDSKKHARENMSSGLNSRGILEIKYTEVLKASFASFSTKENEYSCLQEY